jgi:hypothetical protein
MALALVHYEDLFYLVSGYPKGRKRARRAEYSAAFVPMCIAYAECAIRKEGSIFPC